MCTTVSLSLTVIATAEGGPKTCGMALGKRGGAMAPNEADFSELTSELWSNIIASRGDATATAPSPLLCLPLPSLEASPRDRSDLPPEVPQFQSDTSNLRCETFLGLLFPFHSCDARRRRETVISRAGKGARTHTQCTCSSTMRSCRFPQAACSQSGTII